MANHIQDSDEDGRSTESSGNNIDGRLGVIACEAVGPVSSGQTMGVAVAMPVRPVRSPPLVVGVASSGNSIPDATDVGAVALPRLPGIPPESRVAATACVPCGSGVIKFYRSNHSFVAECKDFNVA